MDVFDSWGRILGFEYARNEICVDEFSSNADKTDEPYLSHVSGLFLRTQASKPAKEYSNGVNQVWLSCFIGVRRKFVYANFLRTQSQESGPRVILNPLVKLRTT